jgi:hypothetical protein
VTRRERENRLALRLALAAGSVLLAVAIGFWVMREGKVPVQSGNFCPVAAPSPRTTLVLIDAQPSLSAQPADLLRAKIESRSLDIVRYERVVVLALGNGIAGNPLFDKCSQADSRKPTRRSRTRRCWRAAIRRTSSARCSPRPPRPAHRPAATRR